jgi:hypothetical protein
MKGNVYTMSDLFQQLGLPSDSKAIADFIAHHAGICRLYSLVQAPMWTDSQRTFLSEAIAQDAEWCIPAEQLTSLLQECPGQPAVGRE